MTAATDNPARTTARVAVAAGPDRGKSLRVTEELVHLGRGADNHLVLTDAALAEHHLSIVLRGGRYAIYTPHEGAVQVDGNTIPHARWVWLPESARIRISDESVLLFSESGEFAGSRPKDGGGDSITLDPPAARKTDSKPAPKKKKKEAAVAKFITDRSGESLVKLGDDGQLPELALTEAAERAAAREKPKETNPLLVYGLLALSFVMSGVLLLVEVDVGGGSARERGDALRKIGSFYGENGKPIQPWQQLLRDARLAASRGDRAAERKAYRRVLEMVNSEDNSKLVGLTGSPQSDDQLRELIAKLLRE